MPNAEAFYAFIRTELDAIREAGLFKQERVIASPQGARVRTIDGREVINLCANNYLGLSSHPRVIDAAHEALRTHGFGLSSVRFICGTQDLHKTLEARLSAFLGTEDTILYGSAFDANGGLFETLLGAEDAVISDALNHASIIDGIRLCKARRYRYQHNDLDDLRAQLTQARADGARHLLVFTDGVFSMDGTIARLDEMRSICDAHGALLGIDECHATGFLGPRGRGTHELRGVFGKVDIITGTLGKALGGASGASPAPARKWWRCCASVRGRTCSPIRWRPRSSGRRSRCSISWRGARNCATGWSATRGFSARGSRHWASTSSRASTPSSRSWCTTPTRHSSSRNGCSSRRVRGGLLLPGGAQGAGPHPGADERGA